MQHLRKLPRLAGLPTLLLSSGFVLSCYGPVAVPGAVELDAQGAFTSTNAGFELAQPGMQFVLVRVTLRNRAVDDGVSRAHSSFTLQSDSGPKFPASPVSAEVDDRCTTTWLLRRGDEVTCRLAFEIPLDAKPNRVVYEDPDSTNAAEAEVTVTTPECIPIAAITSGNAPYDCVTCYNATQCVPVTASIECLHALSACGNSGAPTCSTCNCEHECLNGMASCISDFESCVTASCATECAAL